VTGFSVIWDTSRLFFFRGGNFTDNFCLFFSYYGPNTRTQLWYNQPEPLPLLTPKFRSYLPTETVTFKYPWVFKKTSSPVTAKTTKDWTEKERLKASQAPVIDKLKDLRKYVCHLIYLLSITNDLTQIESTSKAQRKPWVNFNTKILNG
jgi:hypothetical protein